MDIGKFGKNKGDLHPRDRRKLEAVPARPTPKASGQHSHSRAAKPYGYKYEHYSWWLQPRGAGVWVPTYTWYATARQRDQAMRAFHLHRRMPDYYRAPVAVVRTAQGEITEESP